MQKTFSNFTLDLFAQFTANLQAAGITVPDGNNGTVEAYDITLNFFFDGASSLTLTVLSSPTDMSEDDVWSALSPFIPAAPAN